MRKICECVFLVCFAAAAAAVSPYPGRMGVEASGDAFVDVVHQNYRWQKPDGRGGWGPLTAQDVDEHGWPRGDCKWIWDSRPCAEWSGEIDDPDGYRPDRSGTYLGSFRGRATIVKGEGVFEIGESHYDPISNQTTFEVRMPKPGPNVGLVVIEFKDTRREPEAAEPSGLSELRILRPGYPRSTAKLFTDEYLRCLKSADFSAIRFMGVLGINGNVEWGPDHTRVQSWAHRKLPGDAAADVIEPLNKKDGWPWEYVVALCNEVDMDLWLNIPMSVDDDYILQLARLLHGTLHPRLHVYIEHSNEVWNYGFIQYAWNKARAREEVSEGHARYNYDQVNNEEIWGQRRHAQRLREAVAIFAGVFGEKEINRRIRGVLAGCSPDPAGYFPCGRLPGMLEYLKATGADPKEDVYAISMAAYYGGPAASADQMTLTYSVDEILADMRADVKRCAEDRKAMVALARRYELSGGFCAYESGPGLAVGSRANLANRLRAIRDARQADIYKMNFADTFWDLGGNLAMQFTLAGSYSRYGAWGLTDDIAEPDRNSLFKAVRELIGTRADKDKGKP